MPDRFRKFPWWIVLPALYTVVLWQLMPASGTSISQWIRVTFLLNVWVASAGLFRDRQPYSINRMFWLFLLVFLSAVPGIQVALGKLPWGNDVRSVTFLTANLLVLAVAAVYQVTRYATAATAPEKPVLFPQRIQAGWVRSYRTLGLAVLLLLAGIYLFLVGAESLLLQKNILLKWRDRVPDYLYLLVEKAIRSPLLYGALFGIFLYRLRRIPRGLMVAVVGGCLLVNFPLALSRTLAAAVVVGLLLSFGGAFWQRYRQGFTLLLLAGIFGVFPLLQMARWTSARMGTPNTENLSQLYAGSFGSGDFDAYAMLCRTLEYTQVHGLTGGHKLLTSLAFAVPRSAWPGKGIGTGATVQKAAGKEFTNVSCPLPAEGFVDFGWLGALLYTAFFALLAWHYDRYYWHWRLQRAAEGDVSFRALFYPVMLLLLFHLLRGDLLSGLAQIAGMYGSAWLLHHILRLGGKWFFRRTI